MSDEELDPQGLAVRREVLGEEHVDRAIANTTDFTAPFQAYITRAAWRDVWGRPGLDRKTRSAVVLAILTALKHEHEIPMHVRAALRHGMSAEEIGEVLLQTGMYAGVPTANRAFAIVQKTLEEEGVVEPPG